MNMTLGDIAFASIFTTAFLIAVSVAYAWGYRNGIAYCVRELGPFKELLQSIHAATRKRS